MSRRPSTVLDAIVANARYRHSLRGRLNAALNEAETPEQREAIEADYDAEMDRRMDARRSGPASYSRESISEGVRHEARRQGDPPHGLLVRDEDCPDCLDAREEEVMAESSDSCNITPSDPVEAALARVEAFLRAYRECGDDASMGMKVPEMAFYVKDGPCAVFMPLSDLTTLAAAVRELREPMSDETVDEMTTPSPYSNGQVVTTYRQLWRIVDRMKQAETALAACRAAAGEQDIRLAGVEAERDHYRAALAEMRERRDADVEHAYAAGVTFTATHTDQIGAGLRKWPEYKSKWARREP